MRNDWLTTEVHLPLCNFLQAPYPLKKLVELPRGFLKTTVASVYYPIWRSLNNPSIRCLITQNTFDNAAKRVHEIRSIFEKHELFRALYPELIPNFNSKSVRWSDECAEINRPVTFPEGTFEAAGIGTKLTSRHYDLICICKGGYVYTSNGLIPIENVKKSMRVLTDDCSYAEVIATKKSITDKKIVNIKMWGQPHPLKCTIDHRVKIYRNNCMIWEEAGDIKESDYLVLPIPRNRRVFGSRTNDRVNKLLAIKDIWRLIGYWLAEGAASDGNRIRLTFGNTEFEYVKDVENIVKKYIGVNVSSIESKSSTIVVSFFDKDFKEILNRFGTHCYNKHLPPLALSTHYPNKAELVKGYLRGDGYKRKDGIGWIANSVSYSLMASMQLLLASLNIPSSINNGKKSGNNIVMGNKCNIRKSYVLNIINPLIDILMGDKTNWQTRPNTMIIIPNYALLKINKITYSDEKEVYDIRVNKFHSFVVNGACVHNCEDDTVTADTSDLSEDEIAPNMEDVAKAIGAHKMFTNLSVDYKNFERIVIGTRWFSEDMINYVKTKEPGYAKYFMTVLNDKGEPIYPKRFDMSVLEAKKEEMGTYMYATQMMLDPTPLEKMIFKPYWTRYYDKAPPTKNILCIDPAIGETKRHCDSALIVAGGADNNMIYLLETVSGQLSPTEQVKLAFALIRKYDIKTMIVENIAFQEMLAQAIELERDKKDEDGVLINDDVHFSVVRETPGGKDSKDARIKSMIPYVESGKVLFTKDMKKLEKQLREYPYGRKRDLIDVMAYALRNIGYSRAKVQKPIYDPNSFESIIQNLKEKANDGKYPFAKQREYAANASPKLW